MNESGLAPNFPIKMLAGIVCATAAIANNSEEYLDR